MYKKYCATAIICLFTFLLLLAGCASEKAFQDEPAASTAATAPQASIIKPSASSTPAPSPTIEIPFDIASATAGSIKNRVQKMSDKELIGQLVMGGFEGTSKVPASFADLMDEYKLGNVILFGWNIETFDQTASLVEKLNEHNPLGDIPLMVSTDVEGGSVLRFKWKPHIYSAKTIGSKNDPVMAEDQFLRIGTSLKKVGINVDLAPVLDIAKNPDKTFLGKRMYGSNPQKAAPLACAAISGLQRAGTISVGKHYPGHGETATDSHSSLPVINKSKNEWEKYDAQMFKAAIDAGIDGILVGHISYPQIDSEHISSVSHTFITEILRKEMGFAGFIMSDDMRMRAIASKYDPGEAAVRFIEAGGDLVLIGKYTEKQKQVLDGLYKALASGRLTRDRLEESAVRIITAKARYAAD